MIDLYSWQTSNGRKVSIALEELGLDYAVHPINIGADDQFDPAFTAINPNQKIPAIVDHDGPGGKAITIFESGAILIYLARKTGRLLPSDPHAEYETLQWLMWQMGGVGPIFGQVHHFRRAAKEVVPYAIERYSKECARLYGVLNDRLDGRDYVAAEMYTIADIAIFPWVARYDWQEVDLGAFPHAQRWFNALNERPAVQAGLLDPATLTTPVVEYMSKHWSPFVHDLTPYVPGEQPPAGSVIKLNTNENPYGPSPAALAAIHDATSDELRLYPDPESTELRVALADFHGITPAQVFIGNGSDEVLAHVFNGLLNHGAPVLFPDITYSFYPVYCGLYGIASETIPLGDTFELSLERYARPSGGIIFPNPNAPTGRALTLGAIESLLQRVRDTVVVVDEAYIAFGAESAVRLIDDYDNLLVIQTLSKSHGLAGLRVGCAIGDTSLIEGLLRIKNSFNSYPLDRLALAGAVAAVEDRDYYAATCAKVIASRERLRAALSERSFDVLPSAANFLFARHRQRDASALSAALRERAIIVRHFNHPRTADYLRITIGTDPELDTLIGALDAILR